MTVICGLFEDLFFCSNASDFIGWFLLFCKSGIGVVLSILKTYVINAYRSNDLKHLQATSKNSQVFRQASLKFIRLPVPILSYYSPQL